MNQTEYIKAYRQAKAQQDPDFWKKRHQREKEKLEAKKKELLLEIISEWYNNYMVVERIFENFNLTIKKC